MPGDRTKGSCDSPPGPCLYGNSNFSNNMYFCSPLPLAIDSPTILGGTNPYTVNSFAYAIDTPSQSVSSIQLCGGQTSGGDPNLGIVSNKCENNPQAPVSVTGTPYKVFLKDSGGIGKGPTSSSGFLACGGGNDYGTCGIGSYHYWWNRDWATELMNTEPNSGLPYAALCCTVGSNPTTFPPPYESGMSRSQFCPPDYNPGNPMCLGVLTGTTPQPYSDQDCTNNGLQCNYCDYTTWPTNSVYCDGFVTNNTVPQSGTLQNFESGSSLFIQALSNWTNSITSGGGTISSSDPFLPTVQKWCASSSPLFGVCDPYLSKVCATITEDEMSADPTLAAVCGCFTPPSTNPLPGVLPTECTANCGLASSIPGGIALSMWNPATSTYVPKTCQQNTCIISDTTIDMINSVGGGVEITQMCPACPNAGKCTCILSGTTISSVNTSVSGNFDFNQYFPSCTGYSGGEYTTCSEMDTLVQKTSRKKSKKNFGIVIGVVVVLVILIITILIIWYIHFRSD